MKYRICDRAVKPRLLPLPQLQGGDSAAGMQALPVGKILMIRYVGKIVKKVSQICIC